MTKIIKRKTFNNWLNLNGVDRYDGTRYDLIKDERSQPIKYKTIEEVEKQIKNKNQIIVLVSKKWNRGNSYKIEKSYCIYECEEIDITPIDERL